MSSTWTRGPRCGTDNCNSRLYRSIDGLKICQYGHVREGEIEINDDEDDNYVQTKRLKINSGNKVSLSQGTQSGKLYGIGGKELFVKVITIVLKSQVTFLIDQFGLPKELEYEVRLLWVDYLKNLMLGSSSSENDTETEDIDLTMSHDKLPKLIDTLSIIYLGCVKLYIPLYSHDLVRLASLNKLPYMKLTYLIPKKFTDKLPNYYLNVFEPARPPIKEDIHHGVLKIVKSLGLDLAIQRDYYYLFAYQILKKCYLPLEMFGMIRRYLEKTETKFLLDKTNDIRKFPEVLMLGVVIVVVKIYFIYSADCIEYKDWIKLNETKDNEINNFENNLNSLIINSSKLKNFNDLINWDNDKIEKYLEWFNSNIIEKQTNKDLTVFEKRLYGIFSIDKEDEEAVSSSSETKPNSSIPATERKKAIQAQDIAVIEDFLVEKLAVIDGVNRDTLRNVIKEVEETLKKPHREKRTRTKTT